LKFPLLIQANSYSGISPAFFLYIGKFPSFLRIRPGAAKAEYLRIQKVTGTHMTICGIPVFMPL